MPIWNAGLYLKFASERTQPSIDLVQRIAVEAPRRIADLGCGPGNSTEVLRRGWPDAKILGLDSSPQMIDAARRTCPEGAWEIGDVAAWSPREPYDVVFANAVLQWIPGHEALCRRLLEQVAPGGALAVQVPAASHFESPLHQEIHKVIEGDTRFDAARRLFTSHPAAFYYDVLQPLAARVELWETTYYHVVSGPEALLEWYRGSGLRPYLEALGSDEERQEFERKVLARYKTAYSRQADGRVLFPFPRLFFIAYK